MSEEILNLIDRVGSNAYKADDNGDGTANVEMTAAQANKLSDLLGEDALEFVKLAGSHIIVKVSLEPLEKAAVENKRARASSVKVELNSKIVYTIDAPEATNSVTSAWWSKDEMSGSITVNGKEYEILPGLAKDYYSEPDDPDRAAEWQPERTVYVVTLPSDDGELELTSYGVTNLIRRVCARNETIG